MKKESFYFSFPIWMPFVTLTCLDALSRTSSSMLKISKMVGVLAFCLIHDFSLMTFNRLKKFHSIPSLLGFSLFYHESMFNFVRSFILHQVRWLCDFSFITVICILYWFFFQCWNNLMVLGKIQLRFHV